MDAYKLRPGLQPVRVISKEQFEKDTKMKKPWYRLNQKGENSQFAVCPACDNPIQIIAMYERSEKSPTCHGRHVPRTVPDIAVYDQHTYDVCPYANPDSVNADARIPAESQRGKDILQLLRQQFDRVIYILQKNTGMHISDKLAREMVHSFLDMRGHLYVGTNLCNLPWAFGHMAISHSLYGRVVETETPLMNALNNNERVRVNSFGQVESADETFLDINFCFMHHSIEKDGVSIKETIKFVVSIEEIEIYQNTIAVEPMFFHNLVNLPPDRAKRDLRLLAIAEEMLPA